MKFTLEQSTNNTVSRYDADSIVIGDDTFHRSLILSADRIIPDWDHPSIRELDTGSLQPALDLAPELVVLGTGQIHAFPGTRLLIQMAALGVGFEAMATPAACRTYNVLMQEGRNVVAALVVGPRPDKPPVRD